MNSSTQEVFAKQALNTFGFSLHRSAGHWFHMLLIKYEFLEYTGIAKKANQRHILSEV